MSQPIRIQSRHRKKKCLINDLNCLFLADFLNHGVLSIVNCFRLEYNKHTEKCMQKKISLHINDLLKASIQKNPKVKKKKQKIANTSQAPTQTLPNTTLPELTTILTSNPVIQFSQCSNLNKQNHTFFLSCLGSVIQHHSCEIIQIVACNVSTLRFIFHSFVHRHMGCLCHEHTFATYMCGKYHFPPHGFL